MRARVAAITPISHRRPETRSARPTLLTVATALYAAGVGLVCVLVLAFGDRWPATVPLLFGPRWVVALPLAILAPAALVRRRTRLLAVHATLALVVAGPLMGFTVTRAGLLGASEPRDLRVMTHNLGKIRPTAPAFLFALDVVEPDVVVLQECSLRDDDRLELSGWHTHMHGGMCLLSRFPIRAVDARDREDAWERGGSGAIVRYEIAAPWGAFDVLNLHLETPRDGLEGLMHGDAGELAANLEQRRWESEMARAWLDRARGPAIVAGDLNMPVESAIYRRYWSGLTNAFSAAGWGHGTTKRTRLIGARIDHVLFDSGWQCVAAWMGPETGSDHRPVVADLRRAR